MELLEDPWVRRTAKVLEVQQNQPLHEAMEKYIQMEQMEPPDAQEVAQVGPVGQIEVCKEVEEEMVEQGQVELL